MQTILKNSAGEGEALYQPQDVALSFGEAEEGAAAQSLVAWAMVALDIRFGWTGNKSPAKDMKSAVSMAREQYGYRRDDKGALLFNAAGKKIKRSAVYDKLSVAGEMAAFLHKSRLDLFNLMHEAAIKGDGNGMAEAVEQAAQSLTEAAGGVSFDDLKTFLTEGKRKEQTEAERLEQAKKLAEQDAAQKAKEQAEAAKLEQARRQETVRGLSLLEVLSRLEGMTRDELEAVAMRARDIVAQHDAEQAEQARDITTPEQVEQAA